MATSDNGRMNIGIGLDNNALRSDASESQNILRSISRTAEQEGANIDAAFKKIGVTIAGVFTAQKAMEFAKSIVDVRKEIESLEVSFTTLLGSKQKADQLFGEIRQFATSTPMQLKDLASGAQTLLSFNYEADKVMTTLKALGDISMGDSAKFNSLTLAFAQMSATGKLMGQDLLQMINAGFNPLSVISEKTGKSIGDLKDEMSKGAISAQMVEEAFIAATQQGGKFHGMLEAQSKTIKGALSNLQGAVDDMFNEIGEKGQGVFTDAVLTLTDMAKHYKEIGEAIAVLVGIYGTYKAAVAATTTIEKASMAIKHTEEAAALEQLITVEQKEAISKMNLSKNSAEYAAVVKKEALANVEAARAAATKANANMQASLKSAAAAKQEYLAAVAIEEEAKKNLVLAEASGDAKTIEAAKRDVATASTIREEAATQMLAKQKAVETARSDAATTAEAASAAAKTAETAATAADSTAHGILTEAKNAATAAAAKLNAVIMANPYALAAAAVAALAYGIYKLATYETDAEKASKDLKKANEECDAAIASETAQIDILFGTLKGAKKGTEEYKEAKQAILNQYGEYLNGLSSEIAKLEDVEAAYKAVKKAVEEAAKARAIEAYTKKATETYGAKYGEEASDIRNALLKKYGNKKGAEYYIKLKPVIEGQKQVSQLSEEMQGIVKSFNQLHVVSMGMGPAMTYTTNEITDGINNITRARKVMNETLQEAQDIFGSQGLEKKEEKTETKPETKNKKYWEQRVKDLQAELDAMTDAEVLTKAGQAKIKEIAEAQKKADSYSPSKYTQKQHTAKTQKDKQGREALKKANDETKLRNEQLKQAQREREQARKFARDVEQARIDGMEEGFVKVMAQYQLDWDRLKDENERRKEEYIEQLRDIAEVEFKQKNPDKEFDRSTISEKILDKDFDVNTLPENLKNIVAKLRNQLDEYERIAAEVHERANKDAIQKEKDALNEYLKEFGSYLEKRKALEEQAEAEAAKATTQGQRMSIKAKLKKDLEDLDFNEFVTKDAALAFGEVDKLSRTTIDSLISELERYRGKVMQTFDPDKIKKYNEALSKLRKVQTERADNVWSSFVPQYFRERAAAQKQLNELERQSNELTEQKVQKEAEVEKKIEEIIAKVKELTGKELTAAQVTDGSSLNGIIGQLSKSGNAKGAANLSAMSNDLGDLQVQLNGVSQAAGEAGNNWQQMLSQFGQQFGGAGGGGGAQSTIATIDTIVHGINDAVQGAKELVNELAATAETFGADTSEGSGWYNATTFMNGFAEASQGATDAWDSFKSGNPMGVVNGVVKSFTGWIKAFNAIHDAKYEKQIKNLQKQIENLNIAYDKLNRAIDKAFSYDASKLLEQQNANLAYQKLLIQQQIQAEKNKKDTDWDRIKEWEAAIRDIDNAIEDNKDKMVDVIFGQDVKSAIGDFANAYASMFDDGLSKANTAKNIVSKMIKSMIMEAIKAEQSEPMRQFRDMMTRFWADGVIDAYEEATAQRFIEGMISNTQSKYGWADKYFKDGDFQQGGSTGGFQAMSQDTGDELNGRFTTIQINSEVIKEQALAMRTTMEETRNIALLSMGYLEDIEKNTRELYDMNDKLDKIVKNTQNL